MYRQEISQKTSPPINSHSKSKDINPSRNYGSLSSVVQRVQQDVNTLSGDERQQLESAIGTKATGEVLTGKQWVPEFKGISGQLWGDVAIQAKLTIGEVGDKYEREADRVAASVVEQINHPAPVSKTQDEMVQGKEKGLRMKPMLQCQEAIGGGEASTDLESDINSAKSSGQPLDAGLQHSMGQAMGADFSGVRVHSSARADSLNQSLGARAFTTGQDVFFRKGEYQPGSRQGQELIAHELTHVVQQSGGAVQRSIIIQRCQYGKKVKDLKKELNEHWQDKNLDKKEAILKAIENVYTTEKAVEATKDSEVVKTVLAFVNSQQSESWKQGTERKSPLKKDCGKLKDADKWTLRHYTDKYVWDAKTNEVKPPSYKEILSSLTLTMMNKGEEESKLTDKGKVGASKSGHTTNTDWEIIGNVGDTFYCLFYDGQLAGQHQKFLNKTQWYAEWKITDVSEIWASSDWLGAAKLKNGKPHGDAYEGKPENVISSFLGMMGRRADGEARRKIFESQFDNFEVKVHGSLKLADSSVNKNWLRVDNPPETEEQKVLKK